MSKNEFICDCNIIHEDSVKFAKSKMPNDEIFYKLADFYKLIGDTTRCKILFVIDSLSFFVTDFIAPPPFLLFPHNRPYRLR